MKRLPLIAPLLLAGCATVPPEPTPREYLRSLTKDASPIRSERKAGERSVILSAYGAELLPASVQSELAKVMKHRRTEGRWPELDELSTGGERWRVTHVEDLLVLKRDVDGEFPYPEIFVSPDGFIGLDIAYRGFIPFLEFGHFLRGLISPPRSSKQGATFPPIIIPPHRF